MPPGPIVPGKHNMDIGTWDTNKSTPPQLPIVNNTAPKTIAPAMSVRPGWTGPPTTRPAPPSAPRPGPPQHPMQSYQPQAMMQPHMPPPVSMPNMHTVRRVLLIWTGEFSIKHQSEVMLTLLISSFRVNLLEISRKLHLASIQIFRLPFNLFFIPMMWGLCFWKMIDVDLFVLDFHSSDVPNL